MIVHVLVSIRQKCRPLSSTLSVMLFFGCLTASLSAQAQTVSPQWQVETMQYPPSCTPFGAGLECTVVESEEIRITLPAARQGASPSSSYQLVAQPAYSSFQPSTREFIWRPFYSSVNDRIHPDGRAGDHRMYFYSAFSGLGNFLIAFRVIDNPRPIRRLPQFLALDSVPIIPIIAWGIEPTRYPAMRELGFTMVSSQNLGHAFEVASRQVGFDRASTITSFTNTALSYLNSAQANGLKLILQLHIPEVVAAIRDHPALFAIQLPQDEPDFALDSLSARYGDSYYSVETMRQMRDAIRAVAPHVKVAAVYSARFSGAVTHSTETSGMLVGYQDYLRAVDIVFFDYYLQSAGGDYSTVASPASLVGMFEEALDLVDEGQVVIPLIEASRVYGTLDANDEQYPVSPAHVKSQSNALLKAGAMGLAFYGAGIVGGQYRSWNISDELAEYLPSFFAHMLGDEREIEISGAASALTELTTELTVSDAGGNGAPSATLSSDWWIPATDDGDEVEHFTCIGNSSPRCLDGGSRLAFEGSRSGTARVLLEDSSQNLSVHLVSLDTTTVDYCPSDSGKLIPGTCGCGVPDIDNDLDGRVDCRDGCPFDPAKDIPMSCGCGVSEQDTDQDSRLDCVDACPSDGKKFEPGGCGCGLQEVGSPSLQACLDATGAISRLPAPQVRQRRASLRISAPKIAGLRYQFIIKKKGRARALTVGWTSRSTVRARLAPSKVAVVRYRVMQQIDSRTVIVESAPRHM